MSRYIDADKAIEVWKDQDYIKLSSQETKARIMLDAVPSTDVVEVVRCKDCKHYVNSEHYGMMCEILVHAEQGDDFYCGYGQKKLEQEQWDV